MFLKCFFLGSIKSRIIMGYTISQHVLLLDPHYNLGSCRAVELPLFHTMPTYNGPQKDTFKKHCGKWRTCWLPAFYLFSTVFSALPKKNCTVQAKLKFLSSDAFNLDKTKILSGKGNKPCRAEPKFKLPQN